MLDDLFAQTKYLEEGLSAAWTRNKVIANNIANEATPNFKSSSVEFESQFKDALEKQGSFKAKLTNEKHIDFDSGEVTPVIVQNNGTAMREDENNVDIDYENAQLAENSLLYMTLAEKISSEFSMLEKAINEGK